MWKKFSEFKYPGILKAMKENGVEVEPKKFEKAIDYFRNGVIPAKHEIDLLNKELPGIINNYAPNPLPLTAAVEYFLKSKPDQTRQIFNRISEILSEQPDREDIDEKIATKIAGGLGCGGDRVKINKIIRKEVVKSAIKNLKSTVKASNSRIFQQSRKINSHIIKRKFKLRRVNNLIDADILDLADDKLLEKFVDGKLYSKRYYREEPVKRFIYMLADVSGSMVNAGSFDVQAAIISAFIDLNKNNSCDGYVLPFDDESQTQIDLSDHEKLEEIFIEGNGYGGGTDLILGLKNARAKIKEILKENYTEIDLIIATDGLCDIDEKILQELVNIPKLRFYYKIYIANKASHRELKYVKEMRKIFRKYGRELIT